MSAVVNLGHLIYTLWYLATLFLEVRDYVILVSAQGQNLSFFFLGALLFNLGACWDKGLTIIMYIFKSLGGIIRVADDCI